MQSYSLAEIQQRTCKPLDAWWTVLLVDPLATRLVRLVAPYRWITPNRLTVLATLLGAGAAWNFAAGDLEAGALLFHLAFVVDCMDGKVARLRGTGTVLGAWFGFMLGRLRAVGCAAALMGGLFVRTGEARYVWLVALVAALELMRYVNAGQMAQIRAALRGRPRTYVAGRLTVLSSLTARAREGLRRRRIRVHLVSGIEFEMAVFVVGPLTGWVTGSTLTAGALLVLFELALVAGLCRAVLRSSAARPAVPHRADQPVLAVPAVAVTAAPAAAAGH